jgi:hypothetical protein
MAMIDLPGLDELKRFSYVCFEPLEVETFVAQGLVGYLVNALSVRFWVTNYPDRMVMVPLCDGP